MEQVQEILEEVSGTLADLARSDVVVGSPIEVGKVTVVPICRLAAGFGGGGGEGGGSAMRGSRVGEHSGKGKGGGSGGGALVRPVAVVVFSETGVEVLPIAERQGKLEKLLDQIPDLIERAKKSASS